MTDYSARRRKENLPKKLLQRKRFLTLLVNAAMILTTASWQTESLYGSSRPRMGSTRRKRISLDDAALYLNEQEFQRPFRMSRSAFSALLAKCGPALDRDAQQAARSSGGVITAPVRLAIALRILFKISTSALYSISHETVCV